MQRNPYTLDQATTLCRKLQQVVGHAFDSSLPEMGGIECVAVAPFDSINKKKFLLFYLLSESAEKALHEEYSGLLYDVVVIARSRYVATDLMQYDIDTWMAKNHLTMDIVTKDTILEEENINITF